MNTKKVLLSVGATVLAIAGVFYVKASNRAVVSAIWGKKIGGSCVQLVNASGATSLFTTASGTNQASINTAGSLATQYKLYTASNCSTPIYFKP